ncbi:SCP2 sterol-binding domain-containing protein [Motilibacter aurantiacus]|uniref:SCP2 sterol-binding domain-containing protein n=1 Tax=Motilibacter aurantiacus TaxID=2714955 RepID=UPI00140A4DA2|nr:SCP2 sterol-binding domain-containing protein [Motilibacter aurantiacus]NHC47081.1 sterol-binding protein [Motilibacter aurantiacus]
MATVEQCRAAIEALSAQMQRGRGAAQSAAQLDRSISVTVPDLGVVFSGRLHDARIDALTTDPAPKAQIRLRVGSDDLLALVNGELAFAPAWSSGRVKVEASIGDLFKLRSLL